MSDLDKLRTIFKELGLVEEEDAESKTWYCTENNFAVYELDSDGDKETVLHLFSKSAVLDYLELVTSFVFDEDGALVSYGITKG